MATQQQELEHSSQTDTPSDSEEEEEEEIEPRRRNDEREHMKRSNLFFSTKSLQDTEAARSAQIYRRNHYEKGLTKDKRTTVQQVLDKRTYIRLRKLCGQGVFHYMHGVISTGKEANVFEAETLPGTLGTADEAERGSEAEHQVTFGEVERVLRDVKISEAPDGVRQTSSVDGDAEASHYPGGSNEAASPGASMKHRNGTLHGGSTVVGATEGRSDAHGRVAIKVYKTSILVFKDRSRYIEGEFRFRRAYVGTKNPRKMVAQWAEKEFRNLRRIALSGLYSPVPIALRDHILVMDLILDGDDVAPKLENLGALQLIEWQTIYTQTVCIMRTLFQECKLIHGDLSSFNMLYSSGKVVVIDTSQALENDHMNAMPFLKRDCENVTRFFETVNVIQNAQNGNTLPYDMLKLFSADQLFCFILARTVEPIVVDTCAGAQGGPAAQVPPELWQDEAIAHVHGFWTQDERQIRRSVEDCVEKMTRFNKFGSCRDMPELIERKRLAYLGLCRAVYSFLTGDVFADKRGWEQITWLKAVNFDKQLPLNISQMPLELAESAMEHAENVVFAINAIDEPDDADSDEQAASESDQEGHQRGGEKAEATPKFTGKIPEGMDPREWKKLVKEHNRERRKHKIPKHIKKKYGASKV